MPACSYRETTKTGFGAGRGQLKAGRQRFLRPLGPYPYCQHLNAAPVQLVTDQGHIGGQRCWAPALTRYDSALHRSERGAIINHHGHVTPTQPR
jgi:hypothetical protein